MTQRWRWPDARGQLSPGFRLLWRSAAVSSIGDGLRVAVLSLLAATITRDPVPIAIVTAAIWLPWLVLGLHAGAAVDRVERLGSTASFSLLVLFALEVLDTGHVGYGVLLSILAVGGLIGTTVASALARRIGRGRTILIGAVGSAAVVSIIGITDNATVAAALLFLSGGLGAMVNVVGRALRQAMVPASLLGRVTGGNRVVVYGPCRSAPRWAVGSLGRPAYRLHSQSVVSS